MATNHKPGDWRTGYPVWMEGEAGGQRFLPINNGQDVLALVHADEDDPDTAGIARLIKASPDLLEALKAVLPYVPGYLDLEDKGRLMGRPWLQAAEAAIMKATGEPHA